jgi:hypothetical protein
MGNLFPWAPGNFPQASPAPPPYLPQPAPNPLTLVQSYGYLIQTTFLDVVTNREPFFANYTKRLTKMVPVQASLLPYLGIYLIDENMGPDGDADIGDIRFSHTLRIGFSAIIANNNQDQAHQTLDKAYTRIMYRLWADPGIMNVLSTYNIHDKSQNQGDVKIESIVRGQRKHNFGMATGANETPFAELQYNVSLFFRSTWDPVITDELESIYLRTGIKAGDTPEEMAQREQIQAHYIFTAGLLLRAGGNVLLRDDASKLLIWA